MGEYGIHYIVLPDSLAGGEGLVWRLLVPSPQTLALAQLFGEKSFDPAMLISFRHHC